MAYTNVWNDTIPTGSEAANTIDNVFRSVKVDLEQRFVDIFAMPNFTADPLRPYGLKFTDAQDAVISMGDNSGIPRNIVIKNKANSVTYLTILSTQITSAVNFQAPGIIALSNGISSTGGLSVTSGTSSLQDVTATTVTASSFLQAGSTAVIGWGSRSHISSPSDGTVTLTDNAGSTFTRLQLGGTTASFPSIRRSAATIIIELADGSANANFTAAVITATSNLFAGAASGIGFTSRSVIQSNVDGTLTLTNSAGSGFTKLQFGGTTAAFASIVTSGTELRCILADGSAFSNFAAALITANGGLAISAGGITVVSGISGFQAITGTTLALNGAFTLPGAGTSIALNTNKFTVSNTGDTVIAGILQLADNFSVNVTKFTVQASTGNTVIGGTLTLPLGTGSGLVSIGAVDSGGAGFKLLRVPN